MSLDEIIINSVQKYPILYDSSHKYYYDSVRKEAAWLEISESLNESGDELKKKWTSLRDCFRKAVIKRSGQKGKVLKPWKYEEQMTFLKAHLGKNRPRQNKTAQIDVDGKEEPLSDDDTFEEEQLKWDDPSSDIMETSNASSALSAPAEKPKCGNEVRQIYLDNASDRKYKADHLRSFFKAMEDTVRTFSPVQQVEVKSKIYAVVSEVEMKNSLSLAGYDNYYQQTDPLQPSFAPGSSSHL